MRPARRAGAWAGGRAGGRGRAWQRRQARGWTADLRWAAWLTCPRQASLFGGLTPCSARLPCPLPSLCPPPQYAKYDTLPQITGRFVRYMKEVGAAEQAPLEGSRSAALKAL